MRHCTPLTSQRSPRGHSSLSLSRARGRAVGTEKVVTVTAVTSVTSVTSVTALHRAVGTEKACALHPSRCCKVIITVVG